MVKIIKSQTVLCYFLVFFVFVTTGFTEETSPTSAPKTIIDFKDELALKPEQVKRIKEIIENFEKSAKPLRERIVFLNKEVMELLGKEADLSEIEKKVKEGSSLRADLVVMEIEAGRRIDKVLNKEQLTKWREIKKKGGKK
jgi:hypothetical protein